MKNKGGNRFWVWSRRLFRWVRILVLLIFLLGAAALLYLNRVGLPDFVKTRVAAALEAEGLDLQYTRLRLSGYRHMVIDDIWLIVTNAPSPLIFAAKHAELRFNRAALQTFDFKLETVLLESGTLTMDLSQTNSPPQPFAIENIRADLRAEPGDRWTLRKFEGEALGAHWNITGSLTNLSSIAAKSDTKKTGAVDWRPAMRDVLATVERIEFGTPPQVTVAALGDFADLATFRASIAVRGSSARMPWGIFEEVSLRSAVGPGTNPGQQMEGVVNVSVKRGVTSWGDLTNVTLSARTEYPLTNSMEFESIWTLRADAAATRWVSGREIDVTLNTRQAGTNLLTLIQAGAHNGKIFAGTAGRATFQARLEHAYPISALNKAVVDLMPVKPRAALPEASEPLLSLGQHWVGDWRLNLDDMRTQTGAAGKLEISGDVRERPDRVTTDASWGFWGEIASLLINWRAEALDFKGADAQLEKVVASGHWKAPQLTISGVDSELYGGAFHMDGTLDVPTRKIHAATKIDFDLKQIAWLLDPEVRPILGMFNWEKPPAIAARVEVTAPPWVKPPENWRRETFRSATLNGSLAVGPASYRGVACSSVATDFALTNLFWRLSNAVLTRPEGNLSLDYSGHAFDPEFRLAVRGGVDPWAALPLLSKEGQVGLKFVKFAQAPRVDGVLSGCLDKLDTVRFEGTLAGTNILVRNEQFLDFKVRAIYTNQWIFVYDAIAHRTTNEVLTATFASVDLRKNLMYVTNVYSTTDPYRFTKILGPGIYKAIAPYVFDRPPVVRAEGIIPLKDERDADVRFQISGEDFRYWRFQLKDAVAGVHWHHQFLDVTNVTGKFYGGAAQWDGHFTFKDDDSADYRFKGVCTNADLTLLIRDLIPQATNRMEGTLNGTIVIAEANTENLSSWKGHGQAEMHDGFLWSIPIFGIFSRPMDAVVPGLGKSKIHRAEGTFRIENGKVHTKDMEVRAPAFRLKYDGSVDFEGNLDAKVEAELFRNTWVFGRLMSAAFWPLTKVLESKVTGNLAAPKSELAHIPKFMLFPLRPVQTIKDLGPKDKPAEP